MSVNTAADAAEKKAFEKIKKILNVSNDAVFAEPAGSDASFPDFGYRVILNNEKIDIFFEYKLDHKAQMGSMRNWIFTGGSFRVPDAENENKKLLLEIMNTTPSAKTQAKRLLNDFKKHFDPRIKQISSGMLAIISDKIKRKVQIQKFIEHTYDKVRALKQMIVDAGATTLIEIDGGVTEHNAGALVKAGADVLVAGTTVFKAADPKAMIVTLLNAS